MATNTTNYGFKKPDESDFYDVADQNKNWDLADEALKNLDTPTFEDYTGSTAVPSATDAIDQIKSKGKLGTLLSNIKAAFKGACLIGHIVNNCVTDNAGLPLSAAQGKALKDLYTQLYSDMSSQLKNIHQTVRHPTDITTGTNILKLDPGFYAHEDNKASNQDKLNMGLPVAAWHSHIHVFGYWANAEKTNGYLTFIVEDMGDKTAGKIYYRALSWTSWSPWKVISMTDFSSAT